MAVQLKTIMWYLKRPRLYMQFPYRLREKLLLSSPSHAMSRQLSETWCKSRAIDTSSALSKITGMPMPISIYDKFKDIFIVAEQIAKECPVTMGGAGDLDLLYYIAEHIQAHRVIETGVAYGWSSLALLLSLDGRTDGYLLSTDMPYPRLNNDKYVGCVVPEVLRSKWRIMKYADRQSLPKAINQLKPIDMCHYDSDKSYEGRIWAYRRLWQAIRSGGVFISDDIEDNLAFCHFAEHVEREPIVVATKGKFVGVLIK